MNNAQPDADLGWKILHEFADSIPETLRAEFVAYARNLGGPFTSGLISEEAYRKGLSELRTELERWRGIPPWSQFRM